MFNIADHLCSGATHSHLAVSAQAGTSCMNTMSGVHQRLKRAKTLANPIVEATRSQSNLVTRLLLQWASGHLSATEVQKICHAACLDGLTHPEVVAIAAIGSWGSQPGNCNRDLKRAYSCDDLPKPVIVRVPCMDTKAKNQRMVWEDCAVHLPHLWLSCIGNTPEGAQMLGLDLVESFWKGVSPLDPRLEANGGHPVLQIPNYSTTVLPLWIHGDGVEYSENDSLMVFTTGSCLSTTSSMDSMFYMASWVKSVTSRGKDGQLADTWQQIWLPLLWSLMACWTSKHPSKDWHNKAFEPGNVFLPLAGKPLLGGIRFMIWNVLGDLEFFANVMGMAHWKNDNMCWCCDASRKEAARDWQVNWGNTGWTLREPADYKYNSMHPVFKLPGVTSWCVCFDQLHCLDNHGVASHLVGSSLHQLIYSKVRGSQAHDELHRLWKRMQELYNELGVAERLTNLTLAMLCNVDKPHAEYPTLHAKAAETRHLVPVVAKLMAEECDGSDVSQHRIEALSALSNFEKSLRTNICVCSLLLVMQ